MRISIFSLLVSLRRWVDYLEDLAQALRRLSQGVFSTRLTATRSDAFVPFASAFNAMAERLEHDIRILNSEKTQFQMILNNMQEGIFVAGARGELVLMNPALKNWFHIDDARVTGFSVLEVLRHVDVAETVSRVLETGEQAAQEIKTRYLDKTYDLFVHFRLFEYMPEVFGVLVVFHDMTSIRKLENIRREFVASVSHELKTPLTSIRGYAEALQDGALNDPETATRFVGKIEANAALLQRLVSDILKLSQIDSGQLHLHLEPIVLRDFLKEALSDLRYFAEQKGVHFEEIIQEELVQIFSDRESLRQILVNLVSNAIHYTEAHGRVEVSFKSNHAFLVLTVRDTGTGIPESEYEHIFERFYRLDKARSRDLGGTGLGLSIVKDLVQAQGGSIRLQSELGAGSVFTVTFPLRVL